MAHTCHAIGCKKNVPPKMFMCLPHWKRLPREHQRNIWREYRPGQEKTKDPSPAYMVVQTEAILAMAIIDGRPADELKRQRAYVDFWKEVLNGREA